MAKYTNVEQLKKHLSIDYSEIGDDEYLSNLLDACESRIEKEINQPFTEFVKDDKLDSALVYAILIFAGTLYANREAVGYGTVQTVPYTLSFLIQPLALYNDFIKFSQGSNIWAGIGTNVFPASSGSRAVARFDNSENNTFGTNIAAYVKATGGSENVAIYMAGGYIAGFGVKPVTVTANTVLTRDINAAICINSAEITLTLPVCYSEDNGKIIWVKNLNGPNVRVVPGNANQPINYDRGDYGIPTSPVNINSAGSAACFMFVWGLKRTSSSDTGMWVQFKNPRDW